MKTDADGNQAFIPTPRSLSSGDANKITNLLGFTPTDMSNNVMGNIVDMYDKKTEWERKRITESLTSFAPAETGAVEYNAFGEVVDATTSMVTDTPFIPAPPIRPEIPLPVEEEFDVPAINIDPEDMPVPQDVIKVLNRIDSMGLFGPSTPKRKYERDIRRTPTGIDAFEAFEEEVNFYENQGIKLSEPQRQKLRSKYGVIEKEPISDWII